MYLGNIYIILIDKNQKQGNLKLCLYDNVSINWKKIYIRIYIKINAWGLKTRRKKDKGVYQGLNGLDGIFYQYEVTQCFVNLSWNYWNRA